MKFQPGDRVLFTKTSWNPTPVGLVCRARISPRSGNPAYDVSWLDAGGGWTDNVPEDDLTLESRPVYITPEVEEAVCHLLNDEADFSEVNRGDYAETEHHRNVVRKAMGFND